MFIIRTATYIIKMFCRTTTIFVSPNIRFVVEVPEPGKYLEFLDLK